MSLTLNLKTPRKRKVAELVKAIAEWFGEAPNETITVIMDVSLNTKKKKRDC